MHSLLRVYTKEPRKKIIGSSLSGFRGPVGSGPVAVSFANRKHGLREFTVKYQYIIRKEIMFFLNDKEIGDSRKNLLQLHRARFW